MNFLAHDFQILLSSQGQRHGRRMGSSSDQQPRVCRRPGLRSLDPLRHRQPRLQGQMAAPLYRQPQLPWTMGASHDGQPQLLPGP